MAKNIQHTLLLDVYGEMLTEKQYEALDLYYNEDMSLSEIAANLGVTRQAIHKSIHSAEQYLLELEQTIGYVSHLKKLGNITDRLEEIAAGLDSNELDAQIKKLRQLL